MDAGRTSLSAGEVIRSVLMSDSGVTRLTRKVFPVVEDSAELPYIVYRRMSLDQVPVKDGRGADTAVIEILCFTGGYTEGVELAEAVRGALDGKRGEAGGMVMRGCVLSDAEESWQDDAYIQQLVFNVKI